MVDRLLAPKTENFTVAVEGNIGSGKSTFLNYFNKYQNVAVFTEPLDLWMNCNGHNLLKLMYKNPKEYSFMFQSYVQLTTLQIHHKKIEQPFKLMERSIYSARYCFVEKLSRDGLIVPPAVAVIDKWFQHFTEFSDIGLDLIVYLRTSPEIAYERIVKRNRPDEKYALTYEYIKELHEIHEDWLFKKTLHKCVAPVIIINADLDKSLMEKEYKQFELQILNRS